MVDEMQRRPLVFKRFGVYVGFNRHAVRGAETSALRAVIAWANNGIQDESICVSAAGALRNGKSDMAFPSRDSDLDGDGPVYGRLGRAVFLRGGSAFWLAAVARPQRW